MTPESSKQLTKGTRIRITRVPTPHPDYVWKFFKVGDTATLIELDRRDDNGDWIAEFSNGKRRYIEPALVDFEVIYGIQ